MALARTGLGTTSLGAVGGARGVAAGGLRILVEFLTQYDASAVKQLESDLNQLSADEERAAQRSVSAALAVATARDKLAKTETAIAAQIAKQQKVGPIKAELSRIRNIGVLSQAGQKELANLDKQIGARGKLVKLVTQEARLRQGLPGLIRLAGDAEDNLTASKEAQLGVEAQLTAQQRLRASVLPRLSGLAIGALGGIAGGAVIGVGFAAAQAGIDAIGESLLDLIDPARHAREAIKELGEEVDALVSPEVSPADAAKQVLEGMGLAANATNIRVLELARAQALENQYLEDRAKLVQANANPDAQRIKNVEALTKILIDEARATGNLQTVEQTLQGSVTTTIQVADTQFYAAKAAEELDRAVAAQTVSVYESTLAQSKLDAIQRQLAGSAQLAAFAEEQLAAAVRSIEAPNLEKFDTQIEAARNTGPSKRTLALEAQIERLRNAGQGATRNRELANIAEEKALLLLKQRLSLLGTAINLEQFEGKFLLVAIDAKIKALQKQAQAQDRLNRLLDLQFRASQVLKRQTGESISDFTERRAQENREILSEQRDIEREAVLENLEELRDKTQIAVQLQELEERRKTAAVKTGSDARIKQLQKQLEASKKADREATDAKVKALEKQKKAYEENYEKAIEFATKEKNERIRIAISALKQVNEISKLSGEIAGLNAAKSFFQALLASGALSAADAKLVREALGEINQTLRNYQSKIERLNTGGGAKRPSFREGFAEGGVIALNNSSTPFGSNIQFGEQGTEYAVILQHSIAKGLKGMGRGVGQVGPFYMETRDPLRDRYMYKRMVKDAIGEALA